MNIKNSIILLVLLGLSSCSSNCLECTHPNNMPIDICEEDGVNYTDINGMVVPFDSLRTVYTDLGYDCN